MSFAVVAVSVTALTFWVRTRHSRPTPDAPTVKATTAALQTRMAGFTLDAIPLKDALARWSEQSRLSVTVRWDAVRAGGVEPNAPVTIRMRDVKAAKALRVILDSVGNDEANVIGYSIDPRGQIVVSTADDLFGAVSGTRLYDIRDLLQGAAENRPPDEEGGWLTRAELAEEVVRLVTDTIDPDSWDRNGAAGKGHVAAAAGYLVVHQSYENHRQLENLLGQLRELPHLPLFEPARDFSIGSGTNPYP